MLTARKARVAQRAKIRRRIESLESQLEQERRRAERYKKRSQRLTKKAKKACQHAETPRSKTRRLLRYCSVSNTVRRTLLFHNSVIDSIRSKYLESKTQLSKQRIRNLVMGRTVKNCKMKMFCREQFGFSSRVQFALKLRMLKSRPRTVLSEVKEFFLRDDVSRITAGKKETITKCKQKMQRRFLLDCLMNLHCKFLAENPSRKISYALFCRSRPFWVLIPSLKSLQTCLCKLHENLAFMARKLLTLHLIPSANLEALADSCSCDPNSKNCMYGDCEICKMKCPSVLSLCASDVRVTYPQWVSGSEEKTNKAGEIINVKITRKETVYSSQKDLLDAFNSLLIRFKKHVFVIRHQFSQYRYIKGTLSPNECIVHIDFAENFVCKYACEIQSAHFGGSQQQATLHTGVFYTGSGTDLTATSFCTISDCRHHGPVAIWACLDPALKFLKKAHPSVNTIHFFSDGPSSQYRQKLNFLFFCTKIQQYGFEKGSWNFSEAGHGKGPADGVGGALKRSADRLVSLGNDVNTPNVLFDALSATSNSVNLFFVSSDEIRKATELAPTTIKAVPQTMSIHQLTCIEFGKVTYRDVSCFCSDDRVSCGCYNAKEFLFNDSFVMQSAGPVPALDVPSSEVNDWKPVDELDQALVGKFCLVKYDGRAYPGKIIKVDIDDDDAMIQCMARVGENRFFWPVCLDIAWYMKQDILTLITEPTPIGRGRHCQVDLVVWQQVQQKLYG